MIEHPEAEVARAVHEVFSDPAYVDEARAVQVHEGLLKLLAEIRRIYDGFWHWVGSVLSGGGSWISYGIALVVAVLLVYGLVRLARALARGARFEGPAPQDAAQAVRSGTSRELYARAHELARAGEWPDALRHLVLALAAHLRGSRKLRWSDAWTNHELASRVVLPEAHHAELDRLVDAVDRAWYGRGPGTRAEFDEGCALVARVAGFPEAGP